MKQIIHITLLALILIAPLAGLEAADNKSSLNGQPFSLLEGEIEETNNRIDDLEARILLLEESDLPDPEAEVTFSGDFISNEASDGPIRQAWATFKSNTTDSFASIEIRSSLDVNARAKCSISEVATEIANALNTFETSSGSLISRDCNGLKWNVGSCLGAAELNAGFSDTVCTCKQDAIVVRPLIGGVETTNPNWGGVGSSFHSSGTGICVPPDGIPQNQTLEVLLTR